jgi:hypothetical protein
VMSELMEEGARVAFDFGNEEPRAALGQTGSG